MYTKLLSMRIQQLCAKRGITINKLANLSGLRQSTVSSLFLGNSKNPTVRTLHKIASTFNMTLSEFLDFPELNEYFPEEEDDLD